MCENNDHLFSRGPVDQLLKSKELNVYTSSMDLAIGFDAYYVSRQHSQSSEEEGLALPITKFIL